MTFNMRPKEESPLYTVMMETAEDADDLMRAMDYGIKVDKFCKTGETKTVSLPYEGPDLSPGAVEGRPNAWLTIGRGSASRRATQATMFVDASV